ncbi:DNA repair protein rad2, partial [Ceratobasidium sp. UAMH 11750]
MPRLRKSCLRPNSGVRLFATQKSKSELGIIYKMSFPRTLYRRGSQVITSAKAKSAANNPGDDDNYLEDLSGPALVLPGKHNAPPPNVSPPKTSTSSTTKKPVSSTSPSKKKNFHEHDPYRLPELETSLSERVTVNDPRLATDEELRAYVSHLRPDDPEFHDLPADVQYEILGELRLKSRTTSHRRLQKMLRQSKTPMDFSMAQIKNLGQRNRLTQEVLSTLDLVGTGKAGVVVPVKIASEKNREYVLVRNEGADRGFTLGMRSEGNTAEQPIVVEDDEDREGDDSFDSKGGDVWEDVIVPGCSEIGIAPDQDWRDYKRENALSGLAKRDTRKHLAPLTTKHKPAPARLDKGKGKEVDVTQDQGSDDDSDMDDAQLQLAMQASLAENEVTQDEDEDIQRALALSLAGQPGRETTAGASGSGSRLFDAPTGIFGKPTGILGESTGIFEAPIGLLSGGGGGGDTHDASSSPPQAVDVASGGEDEDEMEMEEVVVDVPALQIPENVEAQTVHTTSTPPRPTISSPSTSTSSISAKPKPRPTPRRPSIEEPTSRRVSATRRELAQALSSSGEEDEEPIQLPSRLMTILAPYQTAGGASGSPTKKSDTGSPIKNHVIGSPVTEAHVDLDGGTPGKDNVAKQAGSMKQSLGGVTAPTKRVAFDEIPPSKSVSKPSTATLPDTPDNPKAPGVVTLVEDLDISDVEDPSKELREVPSTLRTGDEATASAPSLPSWFFSAPTVGVSAPSKQDVLAKLTQDIADAVAIEERKMDNTGEDESTEHAADAAQNESGELIPLELSDEDNDDIPIAWSRSPTPSGARSPVMIPVHTEPDFDSARSRESRAQAENEEHASFMSTLQGKPYQSMRESLDAEIAALRKERAAALRDAEDVTAQMSAQIQMLLRLFGVPFVNAPMEAEAQCAFLAQRGLVEGVITDDSDVFLFGAGKVFRNMFNQSKTVECFFSADLERELGLDRETLIGLAYLLGSDYTEGLPGVGPVVAMEIMKEFPGKDGLTEFRTWWRKVQIGRDNEADLRTTFKKRFKKKFKTLHLTEEWPNPKVREAYLDPTVDQSEEKFEWGLPDLDGLRQFLGEELLWNASKVDETLLPIIRRMTQRSSASGANKQGTLASFIDTPGATMSGGVTHAPRKRQAYASKRLQQVVAEYRARKAGEDL